MQNNNLIGARTTFLPLQDLLAKLPQNKYQKVEIVEEDRNPNSYDEHVHKYTMEGALKLPFQQTPEPNTPPEVVNHYSYLPFHVHVRRKTGLRTTKTSTRPQPP